MYRIFCESYKNFINSFKDKDNARIKIAKPIGLIANINEYKKQKSMNSDVYKELQKLLSYMKQNILKYPRFKAFLWTIESRGFYPTLEKVEDKEEIIEQAKLINSFLKLAYW